MTRPREPLESTPIVTSETLLGKHGQLMIVHNGARYTLRVTANKKLILTK